jgi:hypothetical protein
VTAILGCFFGFDQNMTLIKHSSELWQYGKKSGCVILHKILILFNEECFMKEFIAISDFFMRS